MSTTDVTSCNYIVTYLSQNNSHLARNWLELACLDVLQICRAGKSALRLHANQYYGSECPGTITISFTAEECGWILFFCIFPLPGHPFCTQPHDSFSRSAIPYSNQFRARTTSDSSSNSWLYSYSYSWHESLGCLYLYECEILCLFSILYWLEIFMDLSIYYYIGWQWDFRSFHISKRSFFQ